MNCTSITLTYERLGSERIEDVSIICRECHDKIHLRDVKSRARHYAPGYRELDHLRVRKEYQSFMHRASEYGNDTPFSEAYLDLPAMYYSNKLQNHFTLAKWRGSCMDVLSKLCSDTLTALSLYDFFGI